jgi:hypothetical protein
MFKGADEDVCRPQSEQEAQMSYRKTLCYLSWILVIIFPLSRYDQHANAEGGSSASHSGAVATVGSLLFGTSHNDSAVGFAHQVEPIELQAETVPGAYGLTLPGGDAWSVRFDSVPIQWAIIDRMTNQRQASGETQFSVRAYVTGDSDNLLKVSLHSLRDSIPDVFDVIEQDLIPAKTTSDVPPVSLQYALSNVCNLSLEAFQRIDAYCLTLDWPVDAPKTNWWPADTIPFWYIILKHAEGCEYVHADAMTCAKTNVHYMVVQDSLKYGLHVIDVKGGW